MNVELETWLEETLEKGVEVRQLFPEDYRNWCMYYHIVIQKEEDLNPRRVISLIIEAKRNIQNKTQDVLIMDLNQIYISMGDTKTEIETQELKNKKLIFIPRSSKGKKAMNDNYSLTGSIKLYKETALT